METLWETMAEELVSLIACYLSPIVSGSPSLSPSPGYHPAAWQSPPPLALPAAKTHWAESSVGAAHWVQLSRALRAAVPTWCAELSSSRRNHFETAACCRVIDSQDESSYDWPLQVLRLREGPGAQAEGCRLSHATPISRQSLRLAYWAVAKDVHPDRLQLGRHSSTRSIATQAMAVLNEAYRQARLAQTRTRAPTLSLPEPEPYKPTPTPTPPLHLPLTRRSSTLASGRTTMLSSSSTCSGSSTADRELHPLLPALLRSPSTEVGVEVQLHRLKSIEVDGWRWVF